MFEHLKPTFKVLIFVGLLFLISTIAIGCKKRRATQALDAAPPTSGKIRISRPPEYLPPEMTRNAGTPFESIGKEWQYLSKLVGCFVGSQDCDSDEPLDLNKPRPFGEGNTFNHPRWRAFFKRDKAEVVPFLIKQIPDRSSSESHVCPHDNARKGELAVYCLEQLLRVNWWELNQKYEKLWDNYFKKYEKTNPYYYSGQYVFLKVTTNKKGAAEMMNLWKNYYEKHS